MQLYEKIIENGKKDVKRILDEAKLEAKEEKDYIIKEAKDDCATKIKNVKQEVEREIKTEERMLFFETKQAELRAKQNVIEGIYNDIKEKILKLDKKELLKYVSRKIKAESINGNEIMFTNKEEHKKYLTALSTSKEENGLIDLDLLNKEIGTKIKLSTTCIDITGGFILESKYFDLNFSIEEVMETISNKFERQIAKELFE